MVMQAMKESRATQNGVNDTKFWQNKFQRVWEDKPVATKEEEKPSTSNSVSQLGFDMRKGNLEQLMEILKKIPAYHPNEWESKVESLIAYLKGLELGTDNLGLEESC